jgi:hypothetical protein
MKAPHSQSDPAVVAKHTGYKTTKPQHVHSMTSSITRPRQLLQAHRHTHRTRDKRGTP